MFSQVTFTFKQYLSTYVAICPRIFLQLWLRLFSDKDFNHLITLFRSVNLEELSLVLSGYVLVHQTFKSDVLCWRENINFFSFFHFNGCHGSFLAIISMRFFDKLYKYMINHALRFRFFILDVSTLFILRIVIFSNLLNLELMCNFSSPCNKLHHRHLSQP